MIMTPQEKAAAYDKAIERARRKIEDYKNRGLENYIAYAKENIDYIFPELKESEGENMKESLITFFRKYPYSIGDAGINPLDAIAWLEKQGERKPADKVEPNFKVGEWIIFDENPNSVYQVEKIQGLRYYLRHYLGGTLSVHFDNELIRPWTIEDAKAGDVLEFGDHGRLVVGIVSYINKTTGKVDVNCLLENNNFKVGNYYNLDTIKPHPATKEQRTQLEKVMIDAGYTFDFEKKELKKIKQKPTLEDAAKAFLEALSETPYNNTPIVEAQIITKQLLIFLSEPQSYNPDAINEYNPAWSEEDDSRLKEVLYYIEYINRTNVTFQQKNLTHLINFLKSLRPQNRWKPSEEQLEALDEVYKTHSANNVCRRVLFNLMNDLKKLKE